MRCEKDVQELAQQLRVGWVRAAAAAGSGSSDIVAVGVSDDDWAMLRLLGANEWTG